MKNFLKKAIFLLAIMSITALMFAVCASAAGDTKLYKHGTIEWTIDTATGVVTVHPTENGNGVAHFEDLYGGDWKTFSQILYKDVITEIKIENVEGRTPITKITGGFAKINTLTKVTYPSTVTAIGEREGGWAFSSQSITTVGVEGTPEGTMDFTGITTAWDSYSHQYMFSALPTKTILLPNIESVIVKNMFNALTQLKELTIPENVTAVSSSAFLGCFKLNKVTVSSATTNFAVDAFNGCLRMYTIVGHKDSSAYECAKKNGYEFVDITTGKVILEGTIEIGPDPDTVWPWVREEADDGGNLYQEYMGARLIDTYWAWYADEKTLVFFDNIPSDYNETGAAFAESDSGTHWVDYKDVCEKIAVEGSIDKITGGAFADFKALKLVQVAGSDQIDPNAFLNCTSLTSIYRAYENPKEGVADLSMFNSIGFGVLQNTGIETIILKNGITNVNSTAFFGCKNIMSEPTDFLKEYVKDNYFNLININNPEEVYEYYVEVDPTNLIQVGPNASASFNADTGTLTIFGTGEIYGITNYYGGGSKKQPWFSFRNDIKKVVIGSKITEIGKYAFCQLVNLEEVQLPNAPITIGNATLRSATISSLSTLQETSLSRALLTLARFPSLAPGCLHITICLLTP